MELVSYTHRRGVRRQFLLDEVVEFPGFAIFASPLSLRPILIRHNIGIRHQFEQRPDEPAKQEDRTND